MAQNALRLTLAALVGIGLPLCSMFAQAPNPSPGVVFVLKDRHGHATPERNGKARTGGGAIDVTQPREDTLILIMSGVAVAGPHPCQASSAAMNFDVDQSLGIVFADEKLKKARVTMEAQIVGLLRGDKYGGSASVCNGLAILTSSDAPALSLSIDGHSVAGDENLAINDRKGPTSMSIRPGDHHLQAKFQISASHLRGICGTAASAEFAPDPALEPTWISVKEPFHGVAKKEFGFRVILRVEAE